MNPYRLHAYFLLLIVTIIWGVAGVVIKFTLGAFDPLVFLTYRFAISAVASLITVLFVGFRLPQEKNIIILSLIYGFLTSTIGLGLLFFGYDETTAIDFRWRRHFFKGARNDQRKGWNGNCFFGNRNCDS
jgi:drug/metabolite transporter (DMT)-like permease